MPKKQNQIRITISPKVRKFLARRGKAEHRTVPKQAAAVLEEAADAEK